MRALIPTIAAMNVAIQEAGMSVDNHVSKLIDGVLEHFEEQGFPMGDALDLTTENFRIGNAHCKVKCTKMEVHSVVY